MATAGDHLLRCDPGLEIRLRLSGPIWCFIQVGLLFSPEGILGTANPPPDPKPSAMNDLNPDMV